MSFPSSYNVQEVSPMGLPPYFDFISLQKRTNSFNSDKLVNLARPGAYKLRLNHTEINLYYSEQYNVLTLCGSLPWFKQGHNLSFGSLKFESAINDIQNVIELDLFSAGVKIFEISKLFKTVRPVIEYQNDLFELKGFERVQMRNSLYYNQYTRRGNKKITLKFYDAQLNAVEKRMVLVPNCPTMKYEMKLHNVTSHFDQVITIKDLIYDQTITQKTISEMKHHYNGIRRGVSMKLPSKPSSEDLIIAALLKNNPNPLESINQLINSSELNKQERYKRRILIQEKLQKITKTDLKFDLNF